jgi:uncharacterized protein YbjT (DUF2867 family)
MTQSPVLLIGGGGKTGARVHRRLQARGIPTRRVSRSTSIAFDWQRPDGWDAALEGIEKAYITFQPDLAVDGAAAAIAELGERARRAGLRHLVLLSGRGKPGAQRAEAALRACGIPWTIVRASWFNQNFSEGYLRDGIIAGELALPAGDVREPFVDAEDIAEIAAAALIDARHAGKLYEVTGPRALTFAEAVTDVAAAIGRPVRYRRIPVAEFATRLREQQLPDDLVALLCELFTVVLDGRNTAMASGVEAALGRPPRDFAEFVREAVLQDAWRP